MLSPGFIEGPAHFPFDAHRYGERPALHIRGAEYSYRELEQLATGIYNELCRQEIPHSIGVFTAEDVLTYAAILAIARSGACYVPLNPQLGEKKIMTVVADAGLTLVLSAVALPFNIPARLLDITTLHTAEPVKAQLARQPYAYILYTSGSTGEPKGVPVPKTAFAAFLKHFSNFDFTPNDRFLQPYELSWDVSLFCIFAAWRSGACVYVVPVEGIRSINILDTIRSKEITIVSLVPSVLTYIEKYLEEGALPAVRHTFFAGEPLYYSAAGAWKRSAVNSTIHNYYGPTECTVYCAGYTISDPMERNSEHAYTVPIGKIFDGLECVLVNEEDGPAAGPGILCLRGPQVIGHYLHHRDQDKFIRLGGKRFFKTGDVVSWNEKGNLQFHGRKDTQVKINGYRVELQEIENLIREKTGNFAIARIIAKGNEKELTAFVHLTGEAEIRDLLKNHLPSYMWPSRIITFTEIPLGANGKADVQKITQLANGSQG